MIGGLTETGVRLAQIRARLADGTDTALERWGLEGLVCPACAVAFPRDCRFVDSV
jgi:hypothetical protein